ITFSPVQATSTISALAGSSPDTTPTRGRPSLWGSLLQGALAGLANSGHARDFGSGFAAGAAGNEARQQQLTENAQRQQQLDQQKQLQEAQVANYHAETNASLLKLAQMNSSSPEHADMVKDYNASQNDALVRTGGAKL